MQEPPDRLRSVRSYVMRAGRITEAQQRALATLWPRYGVEFNLGPLDLARLFGRSAPCTLEIGFGNGEHLLERALADPERDFLGVEVHRPGVGHLLLAAGKAGITNLRVIAHDAVDVLQHQIPQASLDEVQLLFPDPWPKARHHKRRLVQPVFAALVASAAHGRRTLAPGNRLGTLCRIDAGGAQRLRRTVQLRRGRRLHRSSDAARRHALRTARTASRPPGTRAAVQPPRPLAAEAAADPVDHKLNCQRAEQHAEQPADDVGTRYPEQPQRR